MPHPLRRAARACGVAVSALRVIAAFLCVLNTAALRAQTSPVSAARPPQRAAAVGAPADSAAPTRSGAPVVFGTDTLFQLYERLGPFSAADRAAGVTLRLRQMATSLDRADTISVTDRGTYSELALRDVILMTVLDGDAAPTGLVRSALAQRYALRIRSAALQAAQHISSRALLLDAAYAAAATVVLALSLWLISLGVRRLKLRIEALQRLRFTALRIQDFELLSAGRLSTLLSGIIRVVRVGLTLLLFYIYVPLVLSFFPWTAPLSQRIVGYAVRPFTVAWLSLIEYLPNLFYLAAGVIIVRYILALLGMLAGALASGSIKVDGFYPEWAEPTYKILRVLVFAFAATALYPYLPGASSDAFKGVSLFLGVLFSLGSSAAIGNMVAGIVLTYTRAFELGDRVKIGDSVGDVIEKTLLITRIRTIKNVTVTIPNGAVLSSQVVNFTTLAASRGLILHTSVTIGYDAPWRQVHALLIDAACRTENIRSDPAPFVLQTSLDDFYVRYEINAVTDRADIMALTYSRLHQNIQETFNAGGVEIMSPHYGTLRDGNQTTIPATYLPDDYIAPSFRIQSEPASQRPGDTAAPAADTTAEHA